MSTLRPIDAAALRSQLDAGSVTLVDVREDGEYASEHIPNSVSLPLSRLEAGKLEVEPRGKVVFTCKTGMRTNAACDRLAARVDGDAYVLTGGLNAWKSAGFATQSARPSRPAAKSARDMMRQILFTAGALVFLGIVLTRLVDPVWITLPALVSLGLMFAGLSGWCGMAQVIALAPWNRRTD